MRFALLNSGLGLLVAASELHKLRPDADLIIAMDPDGMPWGPRTPDDIAERALTIARAAASYEPDVIVMACNTGSVHALEALRAEFEPHIPVVGTVPAIKPAAAQAEVLAIWATVATTASDYQRRLIEEFGGGADVTPVACPGLATAIDAGDARATAAAIDDASDRTPSGCGAVVMGCTEYELAADQIRAAMPGADLFGSAAAVAAQALRRALQARAGNHPVNSHAAAANGAATQFLAPMEERAAAEPRAERDGTGSLTVILSGRRSELPLAALQYRQGRELASLMADFDPVAGQPA
ncbi:MAG: aspartate/glutamate racemase family protein [Nocardiopsaceae bacterium]|jgi:glutamate racemase|nr:aspartate/glutamate racemase family protein [Nocardiopsaceae bacterium]